MRSTGGAFDTHDRQSGPNSGLDKYLDRGKPQESKDPNSFNLLNSNGQLDLLGFLACVVGLIGVTSIFTPFIRTQISSAHTALDAALVAKLYAVWIIFAALAYWTIGNAFIKRWTAVLSREETPFLFRCFLRFCLLSPLLGIWIIIATLIGPFLVPKLSKDQYHSRGPKVIFTLIGTLFIFHGAFLYWRFHNKEVQPASTIGLNLSSSATSSSLASLGVLVPASRPEAEAANEVYERPKSSSETFYVHVQPYLSPFAKLALAFNEDYQRAEWLLTATENPSSPFCDRRLGYLRIEVQDCFFYNYRLIDQARPFVTSLPGLTFEAKYRKSHADRIQEHINSSQQGGAKVVDERAQAAESLATGFLTLNNMLLLIENKGAGTRIAFKPMGLLTGIGNPEVPMVAFIEDAQQYLLAKKLNKDIRAQLTSLSQAFQNIAHQLTREQENAARLEIKDLTARLDRLGKNLNLE